MLMPTPRSARELAAMAQRRRDRAERAATASAAALAAARNEALEAGLRRDAASFAIRQCAEEFEALPAAQKPARHGVYQAHIERCARRLAECQDAWTRAQEAVEEATFRHRETVSAFVKADTFAAEMRSMEAQALAVDRRRRDALVLDDFVARGGL